GAGSPDNHDTEQTVAGHFMKAVTDYVHRKEAVAAISVRNYALSAFIGNSVFMQLGYEFCNERQNGVFKGDRANGRVIEDARRGTVLDISARIRKINDLKKSLGVEDCQ